MDKILTLILALAVFTGLSLPITINQTITSEQALTIAFKDFSNADEIKCFYNETENVYYVYLTWNKTKTVGEHVTVTITKTGTLIYKIDASTGEILEKKFIATITRTVTLPEEASQIAKLHVPQLKTIKIEKTYLNGKEVWLVHGTKPVKHGWWIFTWTTQKPVNIYISLDGKVIKIEE